MIFKNCMYRYIYQVFHHNTIFFYAIVFVIIIKKDCWLQKIGFTVAGDSISYFLLEQRKPTSMNIHAILIQMLYMLHIITGYSYRSFWAFYFYRMMTEKVFVDGFFFLNCPHTKIFTEKWSHAYSLYSWSSRHSTSISPGLQ